MCLCTYKLKIKDTADIIYTLLDKRHQMARWHDQRRYRYPQ